jgi:hypothetical protein
MIKKTVLTTVLLMGLVTAGASAWQVQVMVGGFIFLIPTVEVSFLSSPGPMGVYQQEIGLRFSSILLYDSIDLVLRSWFSFPDSSSDFLRQRFKCGIDYSLVLIELAIYGDVAVWVILEGDLMLQPGICASFRCNDPSEVKARDLFVSIGGFVGYSFTQGWFLIPPILPTVGYTCR